MNPTLHAQILTLKKYQAWLAGVMDEAGIVPAAITSALDAVIAAADGSQVTTYHPEDIADTAAQAFRDGLNAALNAAQEARDTLPVPQYHGASRCVAAIKELIESARNDA